MTIDEYLCFLMIIIQYHYELNQFLCLLQNKIQLLAAEHSPFLKDFAALWSLFFKEKPCF